MRRTLRRRPWVSPWNNPNPVREELFSAERLEEHARSLARAQTVTAKLEKGHSLIKRLADNASVLLSSHCAIVKAIDEERTITPAAEWLVDNYHLVEKQIRQVRLDLPTGFYRQLPKLADGPFAGYPRVFGLTWAFIAHTDSYFDSETLRRYVRAYQEVQPLTIGELWAVAITLRIVLIENLRRLGDLIVASSDARQQANSLADRLIAARGEITKSITSALADRERLPLPEAFAVQLAHRLHDQDSTTVPVLTWLDRRLAVQGTTTDAVVRGEHQRQGSATVTIRNIITSMRLISDVDWTELFERISRVDDILTDGSDFRAMDFPTRNLYRSAVEKLARGSKRSEIDIAHRAVDAAKRAVSASPGNTDNRRSDPGYYLIAGGLRAFEASIGFRPPFHEWLSHLNRALGIGGYASTVAAIAAIILAAPLLALAHAGVGGHWLGLLGVLGLIPAIDTAVAMVNRSVMRSFSATRLPALALRDGVPSHLRTLIAVPTLLTTPEAIEEHIERLEIHHLASPEGDLHFALLSDWIDATTECADPDQALLAVAAAGIARLNHRYGPAPGGARFLLLHRHRVWNDSEQQWIGWERKRGKLHELNQLLRGATDTTFVNIDGERPIPPAHIRYVVTLDADTKLPRDTVRRLIGKMAHPLNRPRFDSAVGRVVEGYAVLQPRVTPSLPIGKEGSRFQRAFSSTGGIDPYAAAASDVYQDLFGEGSYTGKGIYDVDAFESALVGRVPDSTLLSHDLFEGIFARAGLASDIEVVEEFPARYDVAALRHHRWARGDWQLLPWIFCKPKPVQTSPAHGGIPAIGRWKMIDNLRRSLSAPFAILALLTGWALPFEAALIWTVFVLATIVAPIVTPLTGAIAPSRPGVTLQSHLRTLTGDLRVALTLSALIITFLAHQAWLMGDAIARTLFRLFVSQRHLLEWLPAAQAKRGSRLDLAGFYRQMTGAVVIGVIAAIVSWLSPHGTWHLALPFAALWIASPAIARWTSAAPRDAGRLPISDADAHALRLTARRTWRFFETFVTATNHMLPPDNFQDDPEPALAHRSSPTNFGLYLLAAVSARDFGWIGTTDAIERLEATLATMGRLARYRGHFYNWYDTQDLRPLDPAYVSSVDSGNLAGHLIALANACREWRGTPLANARRLAGIADALDLACEETGRMRDKHWTQTAAWNELADALSALTANLRHAGDNEDTAERLAELATQAETIVDMARAFAAELGPSSSDDILFWVEASHNAIASHRRDFVAYQNAATSPDARLSALEDIARTMAMAMDFAFLLDDDRQLLSIGYSVADGALDTNCYDLLASEARLASFIAIAKGDIPARHWFRLGRAVTPVGHGAALISWSGSMFEYLMPSLVMRAPADSLLERTTRLAVQRQISYGAMLGIPWGISESAYNVRDLELTYQYSNFGIPSLGLKRGLAENAVVAPYATALAAMVAPQAAARNFERLIGEGAHGRYGFYEALDYTPIRVPEHQKVAVVHTFMAHHQGMTIVAIADALLDGAMRARFHAEPIVQATELLLQERTPRDVAVVHPWASETQSAAQARGVEPPGGRRIFTAHGATPATHLLSNGRYAVMLTAAGSGYSRWRDIALTRWREDATCDDWGSYVFLRDVHNTQVWSAGFQPSGAEPDLYKVTFNEDRAEIVRCDGTLTTTLEVLVSSENDGEVRRVSIANSGSAVREIDVTSYAELVLAPAASDLAHPAFSKLFVETEYLADVGAILATRRRRTPGEAEIWAAHLTVIDGEAVGKAEVETDRARFLGRGSAIRTPIAVIDGRPLSNTVGTVLDPIFAIRRRVRVAPGAVARVAFWTVVASSREAVLDLVDKHRDAHAFERAATLAWTQAQVQLHHLGIDRSQAALFQRLASHLLYAAPTLRPSSETILRGGHGGQPGLWNLSISGDLPILLLRISDSDDIAIARQLAQAHEYWRLKQIAVDLVILNERASSYVQDLQIALETVMRTSQSPLQAGDGGQQGRIFVVRADLMSAETRALLLSVARVVLVGQRGRLSDQLDRAFETPGVRPAPQRREPVAGESPAPPPSPNLEFFNGLGGFADQGREYVTILRPGRTTPAPWINVIANPAFGFQVATEGGGYTWAVNSRENQLTPWSNDPVADRPGEVIYLRDDDTGDVWSPTAAPIRHKSGTYVAHHGRGYSRFEYAANGIASDLLQYVPPDDPIKISRLTLRNTSNKPRRISVIAYAEWVLGSSRSAAAPYVTTEIDADTGALFARNAWTPAFASRVAFADLDGHQTDWTGDRREFIGRNGTLSNPAALGTTKPLSKTVGAGLDPCAALRTTVTLQPNATTEIAFFLGQAASTADARALVARYRAADLQDVRTAVGRYWDDLLGSIQVKTPERSMDVMLNGWLLYQTLACRIWARSAFYQSSGAYGFRDQLQDNTALALSRPAMTRTHLLRAAARQFVEGDVQHWWRPHSGEGVRTRISDDRPWLAYAIAHYVRASGDVAVLDHVVPFLEGQKLEAGQHDSYFQPTISDSTATLFEHGALALDRSLSLGGHGLPLMGTGDWNDGMNRVGEHGHGESVWLAWFLYTALLAFVPLAEARHETARAATWRAHAAALQVSIEKNAWDGDWYRRGYFDDGTPLGSAMSQECRIDSIAQSWAAISAAARPERVRQAMASVERELIRTDDGLALLFTPPFDKTPLDPGYIKGYPPGIRENGSQYTHAAVWAVMAYAALGDGDKAAGLFSLINPINHARTRTDVYRYKVEPYVIAADVYSAPPHTGRGGWTWYTGSAGWMQRAGIESILGLRVEGATLCIDPCIPKTWPGFEMTFRHGSSRYEIVVENPDGVSGGVVWTECDGTTIEQSPLRLHLLDDGGTHHLRARLGIAILETAK
jgi:cyclic beta-1,2-glucan synthetase